MCRVSGELPSLQLKMSVEKYEKIMNLVDKITGGPKPAAPALPAPAPSTTVFITLIFFSFHLLTVAFFSPSM